MSPVLSIYYGVSGGVGYSVVLSEMCRSFAIACAGAKFYHLKLIKFCFRSVLSTISCLPILCAFVQGVIHVGSKKKMRGITTRRIVATVEHKHSFRDWTIGKNPSDPMRPRVSAECQHVSISVTGLTFCPYPTSAFYRLIKEIPKLFKIRTAPAGFSIASNKWAGRNSPLLTAIASAKPNPLTRPAIGEPFDCYDFSKSHAWNNITDGEFDFRISFEDVFNRFIHTNSMFDFSEGRWLQSSVFAFSGYQGRRRTQ